MSKFINNKNFLIISTAVLFTVVFLFDITTPLGLATWLPYEILILLSLWSDSLFFAPVTALVSMVLIILDYYLSPTEGLRPHIAYINSIIGIVIVWITAILCFMRRRALIALQKSYDHLEYLVKERTAELSRANEQLTLEIGKRQEKELELLEYSRELEQINLSKDRFFSIISHDLRGPFQGLLGLSEMISGEIDSLDPEEMKKCSALIGQTTRRIYTLVENLLNWSRLQTGSMEFMPVKIDLHDQINNITNTLTGNLLRKNITVCNLVEKEISVKADQNMFNSILQNLITNAIKFTPPKGSITVSSKQAGSFVEISVADSGVGIDEEDLQKLFRLDVKHTTTGTAQEKGTGLGLILSQEMIQKHGGEIRVESSPGQGSCFTFTLPADA